MKNKQYVYGNNKQLINNSYNIQDWIFGHRLFADQSWEEYMLEFLNVLIGFNYRFNQGLVNTDNELYNGAKLRGFARYQRFGLRRFLFYGDEIKSKYILDELAYSLIMEDIGKSINSDINFDTKKIIQNFLSSYVLVDRNRSWFAKHVAPIHHNFLFNEALRKNIKKMKFKGTESDYNILKNLSENAKQLINGNNSNLHLECPDTGLSIQRNFFARGGELYYLMISAGLDQISKKTGSTIKQDISSLFYHLLNDSLSEIGELAKFIEQKWQQITSKICDKSNNGSINPQTYNPINPKNINELSKIEGNYRKDYNIELGWLPFDDCDVFSIFAEDLFNLLSIDMDILNQLELLNILIIFHIIIYIYHITDESHNINMPINNCNTNCNAKGKRGNIIIVMNPSSKTNLSNISSVLNLSNYNKIKNKSKEVVNKWVEKISKIVNKEKFNSKELYLQYLIKLLVDTNFDIYKFTTNKDNKTDKTNTPPINDIIRKKPVFNIFEQKSIKKEFNRKLENVIKDLLSNKFQYDDKFINETNQRISNIIFNSLDKRFKEKGLAVHNRLAKGINLLYPKNSKKPRYVFNQQLFTSLIYATIQPGKRILYTEFLKTLYDKYGIIIGPNEAKSAKIDVTFRTQLEDFAQNDIEFRSWLKDASFLEEYSDSTSFVVNNQIKREW